MRLMNSDVIRLNDPKYMSQLASKIEKSYRVWLLSIFLYTCNNFIFWKFSQGPREAKNPTFGRKRTQKRENAKITRTSWTLAFWKWWNQSKNFQEKFILKKFEISKVLNFTNRIVCALEKKYFFSGFLLHLQRFLLVSWLIISTVTHWFEFF